MVVGASSEAETITSENVDEVGAVISTTVVATSVAAGEVSREAETEVTGRVGSTLGETSVEEDFDNYKKIFC